MVEHYKDPLLDTLDESHPLILAAKINDDDTPQWKEATNRENADGFQEAMWIKMRTLMKIGAWELVGRTPEMHVVQSTWAFKIKRYPSGLVRKLKACFCVCGDFQKKGVDVFDTYAQVVSWVAGFLGLQITKLKSGFVSLAQVSLIDHIISAMNLNDANPKFAPAPRESLGCDLNGTSFSQEFNYASVVEMFLYLLHTCPELSFAVSQCARYTHSPTKKHATYLKHIRKYLKHTQKKGLLLNPKKSSPLDIQCYCDADFAGLWNQEDQDDPHCVCSCTGYVIMIAGCPVLWKSKLQTLIAQSTMESEYIALSTACKDLLPLQRIACEVATTLGVSEGATTEIRSTIWEDNEACLKLANLEFPYMTNQSKHIALKYHWFHKYTNKEWVVKPIASRDQLGDLFTKGLAPDLFERLRFQIMGW